MNFLIFIGFTPFPNPDTIAKFFKSSDFFANITGWHVY